MVKKIKVKGYNYGMTVSRNFEVSFSVSFLVSHHRTRPKWDFIRDWAPPIGVGVRVRGRAPEHLHSRLQTSDFIEDPENVICQSHRNIINKA